MSDVFRDIRALATQDSSGDESANQPVWEEPKAKNATDNDTVEMIYDRMKTAKQGVLDWRDDAEQCDRFDAGHQWDAHDLEILRDENRPSITFDKIHPIVEVVCGVEIQNRQEVRFIPRHPEVSQISAVSDLATDSFTWANDLCFADDERSRAFRHMAVRGMGWMEQSLDYESDLDGRYILTAWDGMEAWWDTTARGQNLSDTRWRGRKRWWKVGDIFDHWSDKKDELINAAAAPNSMYTIDYDDDYPSQVETISPIRYKEGNQTLFPGRPKGHWPVVQHQWWELEDIYRVVDPQNPDGPLKEYDEDQFKLLKERIEKLQMQKQFPLDSVKQKKKVYYEAFATRGVLLEKKKLAVQDGFTLKCMTAYWDPKKKVWYGLVRAMIEPQRAANKWLSQGLHIVNANAKGGLMMETDAVVNPRKFEDEWAMTDKVSWLKPGSLSGPNGPKIKEKTIPNFPPALVTMIQYAIESLRDVHGISLEMLGQTEGNVPGVSQRQRQQQGMTILAGLFSSLTRFRKEEAIIAMSFIRDYIADGRIIRVGGDYNSKAIQLLRDPLSFDHDIIIDESPRNPNVKMEVWGGLTQIAPILLKLGAFPPELLDYSPMPASLVSKLKERMQQMQQAQAQIPPKGWVDPREREAKIEGMKAKAMLDVEKARQLDKEANFKQVELLLRTITEQQQAEQQRMQMAKEMLKPDIELGSGGLGLDGALFGGQMGNRSMPDDGGGDGYLQ